MSGRKRQQSDTVTEGSPAAKKRGRQSSAPTATAAAARAAVPASGSRQEWAESDARLLALTKLIMFAAGDTNEPLEPNARMLLALMQQQLRAIMDAALVRARADRRDVVALRDILMHAARHKLILGRLLHHFKALHLVHSLRSAARHVRDDEEEENEEDGVPNEADFLSEDEEEEGSEEASGGGEQQPGEMPIRASRNTPYAQVELAINSLQAGFSSADLMDPSFEDPTKVARDRRIASRVARLRDDAYKQFSEARQATYVTRVRPKKINGVPEGALFAAWLGFPPLDYVLTCTVAWLAKEIVTQVVDDAYMCLLKENKAGLNRARGAAAARLDTRHYEEALRKNLGWRARGDVLFGYVAPSE